MSGTHLEILEEVAEPALLAWFAANGRCCMPPTIAAALSIRFHDPIVPTVERVLKPLDQAMLLVQKLQPANESVPPNREEFDWRSQALHAMCDERTPIHAAPREQGVA